VIAGVADLGEAFLREAPYAEARDALLEIPGVGPFAAGAILLRGLGRMDELPSMEMFEREGRAIYKRAWAPKAIAQRYGEHIGYWSYYVKIAGAAARSARA
jgi:DNA-3-methyladenine glycosylase II